MARISLWKPNKGDDYNFTDRIAKENMYSGGDGVLVHKYAGTPEGDENKIQDSVFLENRDRNYESTVVELRGWHRYSDGDFDLTQFGTFMSSDVVRFEFHINDMKERIGRKLISGDVLEIPSEKDVDINGVPVNSYYVINDGNHSAEGRGPGWYPHMWKIRAKKMKVAAPEYKSIIDRAANNDSQGNEGNGVGIIPVGLSDLISGINPLLEDALNRYCGYLGITDEVIAEAESNVFYDPKFFETQGLYVVLDDNNYPLVHQWHEGDGTPPNGAPLKGMGTAFPEDMVDSEYFLRIDYAPDRLFQKQGACYVKIEDDLRRYWTGTNRVLDSYINNNELTQFKDGTVVNEKVGLSSAGKNRIDTNTEHKEDLKKKEAAKMIVAKKLDGSE